MNRKLITYLPQFMQEYDEIEVIMAAEQTDTDNLWNAVYNVRNDQFVSRATDAGLTRFEKYTDYHTEVTIRKQTGASASSAA